MIIFSGITTISAKEADFYLKIQKIFRVNMKNCYPPPNTKQNCIL